MASVLTCSTALLLVTTTARAQGAPRDSTIVRGDRTIWHLDHPSEREWGYAQAVVVGSTIYLSGTVGGGETIEEQVRQIYRRIQRSLAAHGATLQDIVRETVYARDLQAFAGANAVRKAAYGGHTPAATWVQVSRLVEETAMAEIEVTAIVPASRGKARPRR